MTRSCDIAIVGAGMAGASLAAQLAGRADVLVIEAEELPGYHATGRSAAFWTESYGGPLVKPLTTASGPLLRELGLLSPRAALTIGREEDRGEIAAFAERFGMAGIDMEPVGRSELEARIPGLRPQWTCGVLEPSCCDIDVAALHQHYLAAMRRAGNELVLRSRVIEARRDAGGWRLGLQGAGEVRCTTLVNAAGAWADGLARLAGARPLGIQPMRRTVVQLRMTRAVPADLPLCLDISGRFYFKPEAGRLWLSPHDETPSEPCDAAPEELDVALAIERLSQVTDWQIEQVERKWAGLRSFAPDRLPVYGFDRAVPGFFWFAGQGGFGIQTAPAAAAIGAALLLGEPVTGIDPAPYDPARFG